MTTKQLTYSDLDINIDDVYVQMDMRNPSEADADLCREVDNMMLDISKWLTPRISFTVVRGTLDTEAKTLTIGKDTFYCGRIVTRQLRNSEAYAIFICTAGVEYQDFMERLTKEGDMVKLFIAHSIGSVIAERCADYMERILQASIDKLHWNRTNRFSPGYCGWHVREQQMLFPLMTGHNTGVVLTPSSLMIPIKSVSGVIGLGLDVRYLAYTCGLCDKKDCYKKKKAPNSQHEEQMHTPL